MNRKFIFKVIVATLLFSLAVAGIFSISYAAEPENKTIEIDAPTGYKKQLIPLDADFKSKDGLLLHILMGSVTGQNQGAVLNALSQHYDSSSKGFLKLVHKDFIDTEKWDVMPEDPFDEGLMDDALCWAASTAGILWSSGWGQSITDPSTGELFNSEDEFFTWFSNHFMNKGGEADKGLDWFFDGTYLASGVSGSPWLESDKNEGNFPDLMAECLYEITNTVDNPDALSVMERLIKDTKMPAFEASVGSLEEGAVNRSGHSVTALGLITDPLESEASLRYKAIIIADPDNDAVPTIPVEGSTDEERIADRTARPNSYTIYPIRLITDVNGKKCWEIIGYGDEEEEATILYKLLCLTAMEEEAIKAATETEGSKDAYRDSDFLISEGITSKDLPDSPISTDKEETEFKLGEDVYFIFKLLNKGCYNNLDEESANLNVRLTLMKNSSDYYKEVQSISVYLYAPTFFKQCLKLNENIKLTEGKYTLVAEINPQIDGERYPESYYLNNKPITLKFKVTGMDDPVPPTGDDTVVLLWGMTALLALCVIWTASFKIRKKK